MARERDQFAVAHGALAGYASVGRFGWGHPLVATALAAELGLSPTPVREALAHLAGEGVIEHRPGRGYFAPSPTAADIVGLYELHELYLQSALPQTYRSERLPVLTPTDGRGPVEMAFDQVALQGDKAAVTDAYCKVAARLRPIRLIEILVNDTGLSIISTRIGRREPVDRVEMMAMLTEYHLSRFEIATSLERVMRRSASNI